MPRTAVNFRHITYNSALLIRAKQMTELYPWLQSCRESLAAVMQQGRVPHALLLTGMPGTGKAAFADYLARMLLCESPSPEGEPCGQCPGCIQLDAGSHPDFFRVGIEEEATAIRIDQVRELSRQLALSSHRGGFKVAILDPADAMNINAANSLLKTLEEPADKTVLVLVSAAPARLPATVRSRCQHVRIEAGNRDAAARWLAEQLPGQVTDTYLRLAGGAPLAALQLAQEGTIESRRACLQALIGVLDGNGGSLTLAREWSGEDGLRKVCWLRDWIMDLLRIRLADDRGAVRNIDLVEELAALAPRLDSRVMFAQLDRINRILYTGTASLNRQLMMEDLMLAWAAQR